MDIGDINVWSVLICIEQLMKKTMGIKARKKYIYHHPYNNGVGVLDIISKTEDACEYMEYWYETTLDGIKGGCSVGRLDKRAVIAGGEFKSIDECLECYEECSDKDFEEVSNLAIKISEGIKILKEQLGLSVE